MASLILRTKWWITRNRIVLNAKWWVQRRKIGKFFLKIKWWIEKMRIRTRNSVEIYNKMAQCHDEYLKLDREEKDEEAKAKMVERDTLRWVMYNKS